MSEPSRKLSTEEVNALMDGLKSGDLSASTSVKDGTDIEYKKFNFGSDDLSLLGRLLRFKTYKREIRKNCKRSISSFTKSST